MTDHTREDLNFKFSELKDLLSALEEYLSKAGGSKAFASKLSESPFEIFRSLFVDIGVTAQLFFRLIDDAELQALALRALHQNQRDNLQFLIDAWRDWAKWEPKQANRARAAHDQNPYTRIVDEFAFTLNDMYLCTATVAGQTVPNSAYLRARIKLDNPDKMRGQPDELFVSSTLPSFILTTNVLLRALIMTPIEKDNTLRILSTTQKREVLTALETVQRTVASVREQFLETNRG